MLITIKNEEDPELERRLIKESKALGASKKIMGSKLESRVAKIINMNANTQKKKHGNEWFGGKYGLREKLECGEEEQIKKTIVGTRIQQGRSVQREHS